MERNSKLKVLFQSLTPPAAKNSQFTVPANKIHVQQVKYVDSKGQCGAFDLKSNPGFRCRAEEPNMTSN